MDSTTSSSEKQDLHTSSTRESSYYVATVKGLFEYKIHHGSTQSSIINNQGSSGQGLGPVESYPMYRVVVMLVVYSLSGYSREQDTVSNKNTGTVPIAPKVVDGEEVASPVE